MNYADIPLGVECAWPAAMRVDVPAVAKVSRRRTPPAWPGLILALRCLGRWLKAPRAA